MPHMHNATIAFGASLGFIDNPLDRKSAERDHAETMQAFRDNASSLSLVLAGDSVILSPDHNPWMSVQAAETFGAVEHSIFLGERSGRHYYATAFEAPAIEPLSGRADIQIIDLRSIAVQGLVSTEDLGMLAQAKAAVHWHRSHRFCSNCGQPSVMAGAGWRRECPACGTHHFPRTDPVVIMLATHGDRCLMGRQTRFPPGMYSCLAGFLEPGESIEDAVRRELAEESGIQTGYVTYLGSQPWPFPASLMIGALAEAATTDLVVDHVELEDARWFSRDEAIAMLEDRHPDGLKCPQPMAIAHHILRAWVYGER